jgi:hypothetical protein
MSTIASKKVRVPRFSVYQLGRGSDPMIAVGSTTPADALSTATSSLLERYGRCRA